MHPNDYPVVAAGHPNRDFFDSLRRLYVLRESDLVAAVLGGDRREARRILNHLLVHIYSAGQERSELLKGLLLELVVVVSRNVAERGASPTELLGLGYRQLTKLAAINDDEQLSRWLSEAFDRIFTAADRLRPDAEDPIARKAMAYMRERLAEDLSREEVARHAGASPGRLSELLRDHTGHSFVDLLRELRVAQAARCLAESDDTLADIAAACGFCDQSYFTRVFRAARGMTPRLYRETARAARIPS